MGTEEGGEEGGEHLHAQPTQRKKTTSTFLPPPKVSSRSRSSGARSPTRGDVLATGMGGGAGVSHGWTVNGSDLAVIQAGFQVDALSPLSSSNLGVEFLLDFFSDHADEDDDDESDQGRLNDSLDRPAFLSATLVAKFENMLRTISHKKFTKRTKIDEKNERINRLGHYTAPGYMMILEGGIRISSTFSSMAFPSSLAAIAGRPAPLTRLVLQVARQLRSQSRRIQNLKGKGPKSSGLALLTLRG